MAGRPAKTTVDYFPHDAVPGKTLFILQSRFGNNGYAGWFKLLALLCRTPGHSFDCSKPADWEYIVAEMAFPDREIQSFMDCLAELEAIDPELWAGRIVWSQNLVNRLVPAYRERKGSLPIKPAINAISPAINSEGKGISPAENTHIKLNYIKLNKETTKESTMKNSYGEFKNVRLSQDEHAKLVERLGQQNADALIERLSCYMSSKGKSYRSHYATILNWSRDYNKAGGDNGQNAKAIPGQRPAGAFADLAERDKDL